MEDRELKARWQAALRTSRILAVAFMAGVAVFVFVGWSLLQLPSPRAGIEGLSPDLALPLAALGLGSFFAGPLFSKTFGKRSGGNGTEKSVLTRVLAGYQAALIIRNAFFEFAAIIGLVNSMLTGNFSWCLIFGLLALAAMGWSFPRERQLQQLFPEMDSLEGRAPARQLVPRV